MPVTCRDGVQDLMRYQEGVLDEAFRRVLEAHVSGCPRCTAYVRSYQALPGLLREATRVALPEAGQAALRQALAGRRR